MEIYKTRGRTALDFQFELQKSVKEILSGIHAERLSDDEAEDEDAALDTAGVNVFLQQLPNVQEVETDPDQFFPYAIIRLSDGVTSDDEEPWKVNVDILLGALDTDTSGSGYMHVMNMCQRIVDEFEAQPLLAGMYRSEAKKEWALQDEDTYPYYFGGVRLTFNVPKIGRREPLYE